MHYGVMQKKEYIIDGDLFHDIDEFFIHISEVLLPDVKWGRNMNAFNDILRGGFGTPEEGFVLIWKNSSKSMHRLDYAHTVDYLEKSVESSHPESQLRKSLIVELELARKLEGGTVYDWIVDVVKTHCKGGEEEEDGVELKLI